MSIFDNQFITGGLFLGALTAAFMYFKSGIVLVFNKLKERFIFTVVIYDYDELFYALEEYLNINYSKKCKNLEASFEKSRRWVDGLSPTTKKENKNKTLYWKQEPNYFFINYKKRMLLFSKQKKELEHATDFKSLLNFHYKISGWKAKAAITSFLEEIVTDYNNKLIDNKISIFTTDYSEWRIISKKTVKPLPKVILNKEVKSFLIKDLDDFSNRKDWYEEANIPYKRSYLFHGPPGTGKTTLAKAIAAYTKKDICFLNLNSVTNDSMLMSIFTSLPENGLLLIEDIDCVFNQRTSINEDVKITFSCLLNCLDGILSKDNVITIITTNHIEKLDPALIRAGRVDVSLEIPFASKIEIEQYLSLFYQKNVILPKDITLNISLVQELCIQNKDDSEATIKQLYTI